MTQITDFAPEDGNLLRTLPFLIGTTSLTFLQPRISTLLDKVISLYGIRLSTPSSFKAFRFLFSLLRPGVFKALKTASSLGAILSDTVKPFPAIRAMFEADTYEDPPNLHELKSKLVFPIRKTYSGNDVERAIAMRNDLCERAMALLSQQSSPQEAEEYRYWLLHIAGETIRRAQVKGFLTLSKNVREIQETRFLQDLAQVLQIPEENQADLLKLIRG